MVAHDTRHPLIFFSGPATTAAARLLARSSSKCCRRTYPLRENQTSKNSLPVFALHRKYGHPL